MNHTERGMELCSIQDAFPDIQRDNKTVSKPGEYKASKEERRAARKLAKKCKGGPAEQYYKMVDDMLPPIDPDRPAVKRMGEISPFTPYEDAFKDLSGSGVEGFKLPRLPKPSCLISDPGYPSYFGKGLEDTEEGFQNKDESFEYEFGEKGTSKAGAVSLPTPPLTDVWKPLTPAMARTAFFKNLPEREDVSDDAEEEITKKPINSAKELVSAPPFTKSPGSDLDPNSMRTLMASQIEHLTRRFDDWEAKKEKNSKNEILLFVGTGVFILVCMDVVRRLGRR